ncbi:MAG: acetylglutamate kinase [Deltaproteobacteria bacterium]|nr:acetylglutamate kinase [Deltaproteobacteria bacterium]MBW2137641.1 acetylglutamate kinase [Deltaproteobacteria bacterium]
MKPRVLIKIGGRAFEGEEGFKDLAEALKGNPHSEVIVVHGGGAEISKALEDAHRKTTFVDGIRVTGAGDIKIVEGVLSGTINRRISEWLAENGITCRSMSGKTKSLFVVEPLTRKGRDLGYVGRIKKINPGVVLEALGKGEVPVISPISANDRGESYNVNADSAASALAGAAKCSDLVFITDVPGVLVGEKPRVRLSAREATQMIEKGIVTGGMVAKIESALEALRNGVPQVHIVQWQGADTLARVLKKKDIPGTTIHLSTEADARVRE